MWHTCLHAKQTEGFGEQGVDYLVSLLQAADPVQGAVRKHAHHVFYVFPVQGGDYGSPPDLPHIPIRWYEP